MDEPTTGRGRPAKAVLKDARSLLKSAHGALGTPSSAARSSLEPDELPEPARQLMLPLYCASLVEDFHQLELAKVRFEFKDWTVVKAVFELLVRCGICPYLSPGLGIPSHKRFGEKAAASAEAAVSDTSSSGAFDSMHVDVKEAAIKMHPLILSAELLSTLALNGSSEEWIKTTSQITTEAAHVNSKALKLDDNVEVPNKHDREHEDEDDPGFSLPEMTLQKFILSHHLVDVFAAHLQAAYGPWIPSSLASFQEKWKNSSMAIIKTMIESLPVAYVVEAMFILLGDTKSKRPPSWALSEIGKLLSLTVMRDGGIAIVMERLVGSAEKGSLPVFEKVAAQLARVPKSISTKELYYKTVCLQLQSLILPMPHSKFGTSSDIASRLFSNVHQTSILLACTLAHQDPELVDRYLTGPIVEPLLLCGTLQPRCQMQLSQSPDHQASIGLPVKGTGDITESAVVASLLKMQALLTAGHKGSKHLRQQLLQHTSCLVPGLLWLSYSLWPSYGKPPGHVPFRGVGTESIAEGKSIHAASVLGTLPRETIDTAYPQKDFTKGFLIGKSLSQESYNESEEKHLGSLGEFAAAISDVVYAHLSEPVEDTLPKVLIFLFNLEIASLEWPSATGEIADALKAGRAQPDSEAMFLSKLLLASENWELAIAILGKMVNKVLTLRQPTRDYDHIKTDSLPPETILQALQTLEVFHAEVGFEAVEHEVSGALLLLKGFLHDANVLEDGEILELILTLAHAAVSKLHQNLSSGKTGEEAQVLNKNEQETICSIEIALKELQRFPGIAVMHKNSAARLISKICELLKDFVGKS